MACDKEGQAIMSAGQSFENGDRYNELLEKIVCYCFRWNSLSWIYYV